MAQHFLFLSLPDRGHVFPSLTVAEELIRRGHRVTFVTGESLTDRIEAAGARALPYDSEYDRIAKIDGVNHDGGSEMLMLTVDESASMIRTVEAELADDRPDLVAYDVATSHAGRILERKWDLPAVQLMPMFAQNENFSFAEAYQEDGVYTGPDPMAMGEWVGKIMELLEAHDLDVSFEEFFMGTQDFSLVYLPKAFQVHGDSFGEEFFFVGPCTGDRKFLGDWQPPTTDLPIVLLSLGTIFNEFTDFFRMAVQAFTGEPVHIVMTVGGGMDPADLGPLPPNIEAHNWISHVAVLEHARAFVTHGGMGSLMESFEAGKPVVIVPLSPLDRPTAKQVVELELGLALRPADITVERLRETVSALLKDETALRNAQRMSQEIAAAGGTHRAADEIEAYLKRGR